MDREIIDIIYFVSFIFVYLSLLVLSKVKIRRSMLCLSMGIILFVLLGFRTLDQGLNDTRETYLGMYEMIHNMNWGQMYSSQFAENTSMLFVTWMKLINILSFNNFRVFIVISAFLFVAAFEYLIYRCCQDVLIGNLFFISFLYPYGFYLLRQCYALIFCALALQYSSRQYYRKGAVMGVIAGLIHSISFVFLAALLLYYFCCIRFRFKAQLIQRLCLLMAVLMALIPSVFKTLLILLPQNSKYMNLLLANVYQDGELWLAPLLVNIAFYCFFCWKYSQQKTHFVKIHMTNSVMAIVGIAASAIIQDMYRLALFFYASNMVLLSNAFVIVDKQASHKFRMRRDIFFYLIFIAIGLYLFIIVLPNNNIISIY